MLTRTDNGNLHSQGINISGQHYLFSEEGEVSKPIRRLVYSALLNQIRESGKTPKSATLEIKIS